MVKPEAAWALGYTGSGVKVAVIDSGVQSGTHDLTGRVTSDSTDVVGARNQPYAPRDVHGTMVAGFVAANFNSRGTVGVAYNADILSIRADEIGPCGTDAGAPADSDCGFFGSDLSAAIDYARLNGAKVINLSLGGDSPTGSQTRSAIQRATAAGLVIVAAAGNADTGSSPLADPGYPAHLAIDVIYNGQIIAVGALNAAGDDIASFSYRAGVAQNFYLLAPGEHVASGCGLPSTTTPGGTVCYTGSGTSFATPVVSGAAALLIGGFPNLSAHEVVDILLRTARDMGAPGPDPIYGRGALDISRAFSPIGALSLATPGGLVEISEDVTPGAAASPAFGDALTGHTGLATVAYDEYSRLFRIDLGGQYRSAGQRNLALRGGLAGLSSGINVTTPDGAQLQIAASHSGSMPSLAGGPAGLALSESVDEISTRYSNGGLRFDAWSGRSGGVPNFASAEPDAFSLVAMPEHAARAGYAFGPWTVSAEQGQGRRGLAGAFDLTGTVDDQRTAMSRYARLTANFRGAASSTTFGLGQLDEQGGPLGALAPRGSELALPARSRFFSLQSRWRVAPGVGFAAEASVGRTEAQGRALSIHGAVSSSWRLQAQADCQLFRLACSGLAFEIAQPLRVEAGRVSAFLADQPVGYFDPLTYSSRTFALSPSGRELDLRLTGWRDLGSIGALQFDASAIVDEGHRADAPLNLGVSAGWRRRF